MGCVCAKGRPTLKVSMNKTTIREDSINQNGRKGNKKFKT